MKVILPLVLSALFSNVLCAQNDTGQTQQFDSASIKLSEVNISLKYQRNYKTNLASGTLKLKTALLHLPQNIQTIDKSVISDQQATDVNESLTRNVSGAVRNNTADLYGPMIMMRGANIGTLRNGIDISMAYFGPMPEDAAIIEKMEFIKGPAGFINPIGDPAGSYNVVTRAPTGTSANRISFTAGSFNLYRLAGDFNGSFDKKKKWQYRLNLAGQKSQSFQQFAFHDKIVVQPVIRYQINSLSSLTAEFQYNRQRFQQYMAPVFSPFGYGSLPHSFTISDPNKRPAHASENSLFLTYNLRLSRQWQITAKAAHFNGHMKGDYFLVSSYNPAKPGILPRRLTYETFDTRVTVLQAFVNGNISTGSIGHQLLASVDYNKKNFLGYAGYNDPAANPAVFLLDVSNPTYGLSFTSYGKEGKLSEIATNQHRILYYTAYLQDELALAGGKLKITLAARLTASESSILLPRQSEVKDLVVTPRAGISYRIAQDFSAYALWDHSYTPQSGINTAGGIFKPLKGRNLEAGLKKDWAGGKWNTSLSFYHINRDNIIVPDPANKNELSQIGQTRSQGVEFDLKGELIPGLNTVINYAYTDSYISKDANKLIIGTVTPYLVRHIQNSWLTYRLPFKKVNGFSVSAGYQLQAKRNGRYPQDPHVPISNLFRVDGGLGWSNKTVSVQGLINNVFDRFNYGSAWNRPAGLFAYVPYAPREYRITVAYSF